MTEAYSDDQELQDLRTRLEDADAEVRRIALLDLTDIAGDEHAGIFVAALRDVSPRVR